MEKCPDMLRYPAKRRGRKAWYHNDNVYSGSDVPDSKFTGYRIEPDIMNYPTVGYRIPDISCIFFEEILRIESSQFIIK